MTTTDFLSSILWKDSTDVVDVFIQCEGVGTNTQEICFEKDRKRFIVFNYNSYGVVHDIFTLMRDIRQNDGIIAGRKKRLNDLVALIKSQVIQPNVGKVALVGISHGSLLMHAAIVRLKCDIMLKRKQLEKLYFYTIGSPKYPQPFLLHAFEEDTEKKLVNFYHQKDEKVQQVKFLPGSRARHFQSPGVSLVDHCEITNQTSSSKCVFKLDIARRLLVHTQIHELFHNNEDVNTSIWYHCNTYLLYPLFKHVDVAYNLDKDSEKYRLTHCYPLFNASIYDKHSPRVKNYLGPKCTPEPVITQQGGTKKTSKYILYNKRKYKVRKDKDTRREYIVCQKQKTFLKDIKNKYKRVKTG